MNDFLKICHKGESCGIGIAGYDSVYRFYIMFIEIRLNGGDHDNSFFGIYRTLPVSIKILRG